MYITGESYAGVYVPRLVEKLDQYIENCNGKPGSCSFTPNLKGWIVANGITDLRFDNENQLIEMIYWYSILDTPTYEGIKTNNCTQ